MKVYAVIGANYGDEGKGQTVNDLSDNRTLVVRYNGGAQAGHTVEMDGKRHVFHHFGSGVFQGASTFLGKRFVINPMLFRKESRELLGSGMTTTMADLACLVTTPFDIMLNQAVEKKRGANRHGSCGVGFNETIKRSERNEIFKFTLGDCTKSSAKNTLQTIWDHYVPERAADLDLKVSDLPYHDKVPQIIDSFLTDCGATVSGLVPVRGFSEALGHMADCETVIFEGAQGLRLDEFASGFPHVTHSRTGLPNVAELLNDIGFRDTLHALYITRPYITRHGAGPLSHEVTQEELDCFTIVDNTNIPNDYQGTLRFAWHDAEQMLSEIKDDLQSGRRISEGFTIESDLVITCLDQLKCAGMKWFEGNQLIEGSGLAWGLKMLSSVRALSEPLANPQELVHSPSE